MLQKGYLYQNGVEFHDKVIGPIVNLATPMESLTGRNWSPFVDGRFTSDPDTEHTFCAILSKSKYKKWNKKLKTKCK